MGTSFVRPWTLPYDVDRARDRNWVTVNQHAKHLGQGHLVRNLLFEHTHPTVCFTRRKQDCALYWVTHLQFSQVWHVLTRDHTVLTAIRTFIYKWNEPYLPLLLSGRASPLFGRYSFPDPLRLVGWVSLSGWLHTQIVYQPEDGHQPVPT